MKSYLVKIALLSLSLTASLPAMGAMDCTVFCVKRSTVSNEFLVKSVRTANEMAWLMKQQEYGGSFAGGLHSLIEKCRKDKGNDALALNILESGLLAPATIKNSCVTY